MVAGQNVPLGEPHVQVDLLASHADLSVLLVGANGRVDRDEDFIFYNNPRSADGAVTLTANSASIDTDLLPQRCERVVLVVSAATATPWRMRPPCSTSRAMGSTCGSAPPTPLA